MDSAWKNYDLRSRNCMKGRKIAIEKFFFNITKNITVKYLEASQDPR